MTVTADAISIYHETLRKNAHVKRLYERAAADPDFRDLLRHDPATAVLRPELYLTRQETTSLLSNPSQIHNGIADIVREKTGYTCKLYQVEALPADPLMLQWRHRQIARQKLDLGPFLTDQNIHASMCFEMTEGCSVGCWFCSLSPDRLQQVFRYDPGNAALWRSVLKLLSKRFGRALRSGFLYWATDPMDNPDYEKFCLDYYDIAGIFPPTTTALALKDATRTRALIRTAHEHSCWINRFSVLSLKMLERIHREFTAEELAFTECLPLNPESAFAFANAGRFREKALQEPNLLADHRKRLQNAPPFRGNPDLRNSVEYALGSNACVTGFLFNMVRRTVELISPCTADDRHPKGYIVFARGHFTDVSELESLLDQWIEEHMDPGHSDQPVSFHDFVQITELEDGFCASGRFRQSVDFRDAAYGGALKRFASLCQAGDLLPDRAASILDAEFGAPQNWTFDVFNRIRQQGLVKDRETTGVDI